MYVDNKNVLDIVDFVTDTGYRLTHLEVEMAGAVHLLMDCATHLHFELSNQERI